MAGIPPIEVEAVSYAERYKRRTAMLRRGVKPTAVALGRLRQESRRVVLESWEEQIINAPPSAPGKRVLDAVRPCFKDWVSGVIQQGGLPFRAAQVITGHGVFGDYLCRIGRESSPRCWECGAGRDSADHTLAECPAFASERRALISALGPDLSLPAVISAVDTTMEMADQEKAVLPPQGIRTLRDRRGGSAVPAPAMSSSNDGRSNACSAGALVETASAKNKEEEGRDRSDLVDRGERSCLSEEEREAQEKTAPLTDTDGEYLKLPRLVEMKIVKRAGSKKKTGPKSTTRVGPRSRTKQPSDLPANFCSVRPNFGSPPPLSGLTEASAATATEEEEGNVARWTATSDQDTDVQDTGAEVVYIDSSDASDASIRTTASGASKRTRRRRGGDSGKKTRRLITRKDRSSSSEENFFTGNEKKKRGRPIVSGKRGCDPRYPGEGKLEQESVGLPIQAIAAEILQTTKQIEEVAVKFNNLKGGFVRILRDAALKIEVNADAMTRQALPLKDSNAQEIEQFRAEVMKLREELKQARDSAVVLEKGKRLSDKLSERDDATGMDIDEEENSNTIQPPPPSVTLPPREEWPPAIRPAIRGKCKKLPEDDPEVLAARSSAISASGRKPTPRTIENLIDSKLSAFAKTMQTQMREMVAALVKQFTPQASSDGARKDAPKAPIPKDGTKGRQVPKREDREISRSRKGEVKGQKPEASTSSVPSAAGKQPTSQRKPASSKPSSLQKNVPEEAASRPTETWSQVARRGATKKAKKVLKPETSSLKTAKAGKEDKIKESKRRPATTRAPSKSREMQPKKQTKKKRRRVPRTSAIVLSSRSEGYDKLMSEVRSKVKLSEVGINEKLTMRTTATGALLIQVPGNENSGKADALASLMKEALAHKKDVIITRPVTTAEIRVWPLEPSITKSEVIEAVADKGYCQLADIQGGDIRKLPNNMGSLWLRLPLASAKKVADGGTLSVGWSKVRVALLDPRPLRCYKCLERGHTKDRCPNSSDRSGLCYRCGESGHVARTCSAPPRCPICADIGRKADHILGGKTCTTQRRKGIPIGGNSKSRLTEESPMEVEVQSTFGGLPQRSPQRKRPLEEGDKPVTT
ncbi:uncharacterized protein [Cardiocondyla obscurior]|uniref:uncharacterized protein n=1 Tax=Cardiocondyla obscurior TaxID=286306 RepID=UPI0039655DBA